MLKIQPNFHSRYFHITLFFIIAGIAAIVKLFQIQIVDHDKIEQRIDSKVSRTTLFVSGRGKIISKDNKVLSEDKPCYQLTIAVKDLQLNMGIVEEIDFYLHPKSKRFRKLTRKGFLPTQKKTLLKKIANLGPRLKQEPTLINLALEYNLELDKLVMEIRNAMQRCTKQWVYLRQKQTLEIYLDQFQAFSILKEKQSSGFSCIKSSLRTYPNNEIASHLVGHLGPITEKEYNVIRIKGHYPKNEKAYHPIELTELEKHNLHLINNYHIGKMGVEYLHNQTLRGKLSKYVSIKGVGVIEDEKIH
jgi:cell division protein FtsI/penicillin-binding protein 2